MSETIPRNCGACSHFDMRFERGYYGDVTSELRCLKGHWTLDMEWDENKRLRDCLATAEACPDYEVYSNGSA